MATGTTIELDGLTAFCAKPQHRGTGGVLLLPSHYGINDYARDHVHALAGAGLVALACNQYSGRPSFVPSAEEAVRWGSERCYWRREIIASPPASVTTRRLCIQ
jgi:dienelactone hydrolase